MKNIIILLLTLISSTFAYDSYFTNSTRGELFDKTDLKVANLTINFNDDDLNTYYLTYQCMYDTNIRYHIPNENCYSAPWVNLTSILSEARNYKYFDSNSTSIEDLELFNKNNITFTEFEHLFSTYTNYTIQDIFTTPSELYTIPVYETENAGMTLDVDGEIATIPNIKFAVGGKYTKIFEKLGFNIKVKKGVFLDRKQLRLRTEAVDPSFLREKLAYDICNVIGLPSLSSNYVRLFFNDNYMGLYLLRDAFKSQWIEFTFGEKSTKHLYTCDRSYGDNSYFNCINDDEDIKEDKDLDEFLKRLAKTETREELEEFFDVKTYIKWQALKYLFGSWDHVTNAHNQVLYMYHDTSSGNDMWIPLLYDFDSEFGAYKDIKTRRSFEEESLELPNPLYKILKLNDQNEELISYIDEFMRKAFNPKDLFARIDQLKEFLSPYIKEDRTPLEDGRLPDRLKRVNVKVEDYFTYEDYSGNSEYTMIQLHKYTSDVIMHTDRIMGLKQWIIERFQFACEFYKLDCSYASEYLDGYEYETNTIEHDEKNGGCHNTGYPCCYKTEKLVTTDSVGFWGIENGDWCLFEEPIIKPGGCWSEFQGFPCCKDKHTVLYYVDPNTGDEWGVENDDWCGITDIQRCPSGNAFNCCSTCEVYYEDTEKWGVENSDWCSIPYSCSNSTTTATNTTATPTIKPPKTLVPIPTDIGIDSELSNIDSDSDSDSDSEEENILDDEGEDSVVEIIDGEEAPEIVEISDTNDKNGEATNIVTFPSSTNTITIVTTTTISAHSTTTSSTDEDNEISDLEIELDGEDEDSEN